MNAPHNAVAALALGPEDLAVLRRLRAVARLLRAAVEVCPPPGPIQIGLCLNLRGGIWPFAPITLNARLHLARLMDWHDLLAPADIDARIVATEFPHGGPAGLRALLIRLESSPQALATEHSLLAAQGWAIDPSGHSLFPLVEEMSAHEALDAALEMAQARGVGAGPVAALAAEAVAALIGGGR